MTTEKQSSPLDNAPAEVKLHILSFLTT